MGQDTQDQDRLLLADKFYRAGEKRVALPAPARNLYTPEIAPAVANILSTHNTLYFGEWHDDVNHKFLADNPDIFKQAKAHNATKMFLEMHSSYAPVYKAYFDGKLSDNEFQKQLIAHNRGGIFSSGDSAESMAQQLAAEAKTAKASGVRILPSDFRDLEPNRKVNLPINYTSAAYGIPDVQGLDDSVQHQTNLSLEEYKKQYASKTGFDVPVTVSQQTDFKYLHAFRIEALSETEKDQFKKDLSLRERKFLQDENLHNLNYQNKLQFIYYTMLVEPGEKTIFMGGREHISAPKNTGTLLEAGGYGTTGSIHLLSDGALLHDKGQKIEGKDTPNGALEKPFDFIAHTETGQVTKFDGQRIAPQVQNMKVETTTDQTFSPDLILRLTPPSSPAPQ